MMAELQVVTSPEPDVGHGSHRSAQRERKMSMRGPRAHGGIFN